ncbi:MAG: MBL fold metallo-hydrolase [Fusobacteriaceae bacterium]
MNIFLKIAAITAVSAFPFSTQLAMASEPPVNIMAILHDNTRLEPAKIFDNLYCIGSKSVVAWALKTTEGIILIDAMWDDEDAKSIINGMEKLGLNPAEIKYIVVTHGHGDHYGGANFLRDKFNAKVIMTEVDAKLMKTLNVGPNSSRSPKTPVDIFVKDGDKVVLGDSTITIVETPGHTPGGISLIFPIKNDGEGHTAILWGGTGVPSDLEGKLAYQSSVAHFEKKSKEAGATIELTAHLFLENGYKNLDKARIRQKGEENPFILGKEGIDNYFKKLQKSIDDTLVKK